GSRLLSPYSPKLISLPRVATPVMRPRICFRCLTFFGINIAFTHCQFPIADCRFEIGNWQLAIGNLLLVLSSRPTSVRSTFAFASRARASLAFAGARLVDRIRTGTARHRRLWIENLAAIDPNLDPDLSKRRLRFSQTVIDIGAQSVQRKLSLQVPLAASD